VSKPTEELIANLSHSRFDVVPTPSIVVALGAAIAASASLLLSIVWLRPRTDLTMMLLAENGIFLVKLAFAIGLVLAALPIVRDLSVPGRRVRSWSLLCAPFLLIVILALRELAELPLREWSHHLGAASWLECLWQIPVLALPAFVILTGTIRYLAPTKLMQTGTYIGLVAGSIGAVGYSFHCHDDSLAFVAVFYSIAIIGTALFGALLGPRILAWGGKQAS